LQLHSGRPSSCSSPRPRRYHRPSWAHDICRVRRQSIPRGQRGFYTCPHMTAPMHREEAWILPVMGDLLCSTRHGPKATMHRPSEW
jgi:hypothetical protein